MFSVITPVYDPPAQVLHDTIASVRAQSEPDWELLLVDDCSSDPTVRAVLRAAAAEDDRIVVIEREQNGGIATASQDALDRARGDFIALLDHDDQLAPTALATMAAAIKETPNVDYLYSDEDKIDRRGRHVDPFHKPIWSPERLRSQMYTGHLSVLRTDLVRAVGGFRPGFDGSQDHDLVLRVSERAREIVHIPEILYHWRVVPGSAAGDPHAKGYAWTSGLAAVRSHLERLGMDADVDYGSLPNTYRVHRRLPAHQLISVIIPTRGSSGVVLGQSRCFVVEAVRAALRHTAHRAVEFVVVYDTSTPAQVLADLRTLAGDALRLVEFAEPFNFSRKCNAGYLAASGDIVVMLNDDTEALSDGWLEALVGPLAEPSVGVTGARTYFEDGTIQHAGHVYHLGEFTHAFLGYPPASTAEFSAVHLDREVSGVTAACLAVRRDVYDAVGGFCEELPVNFNDVDFCLKVRRAGWRILYVAQSELSHFESRTRVPVVHEWEQTILLDRWGRYAIDDYLPLARGARRGRIGRRHILARRARRLLGSL